MFAQGGLTLGALVSNHLSLDQIELAFADMSAGQSARCVNRIRQMIGAAALLLTRPKQSDL